MDSDRESQDDASLLTGPLRAITGLVLRWPKVTMGLAILLAIASVACASLVLQFRTSRLDLINPESAYNKRWIDFIEDFGDRDDAVVVVEAESPERVRAGIEHAAAAILRRDELFESVLYKIDLDRVRAKGLHHLRREDLERIDHSLHSMRPVLSGDWSGLNLGTMLPRLAVLAADADSSRRQAATAALKLHLENLQAALERRDAYQSPWPLHEPEPPAAEGLPAPYMLTGDGRMGLVLLHLKSDGPAFAQGSHSIDELRRMLKQLENRHADIRFGLTGLPVMENDEMRASQQATIKASIVSLLGVACLFVAGFGGLRHPLMTVASLMIALAWSLGYLTLAVGHLNILSMSFGVILIGLGIDFGIHFLARYMHLRAARQSSREALQNTSAGVGPGIVVGGATTAIAFFTTGLTRFTGVAELGLIAGGGVLLCVVSALVVLPAFIYLADRNRSGQRVGRALSVRPSLAVFERFPRLTIIVSVASTLVVATGLPSLWYDHNLLNLQPLGLESVELEERLLAETDQSVWFALSLAATPEEVLARKRQFEQLPSVQRTEEIASLVRAGDEEKSSLIERIAAQLADLPDQPPLLRVVRPDELVDRLEAVSARLDGRAGTKQVARQLRLTLARIAEAPESEALRQIARYQQRVADDLLESLDKIRAAADPEPPELRDLPPSLVDRFVGHSGRYLLKVYSKADIWNMEELEQFVREVRSVDPQATGKPLQTYEASQEMLRSYMHAALYALLAVLMVLILDFQRLGYCLLALAPVGLGMLQMFGLLGMFGIPLNPANMIVVPLILGIGLDDGVHVIHDFRSQSGPYRLSRSTATAVLLTSLTTMIGFGSMMIAEHQGLQSLGRVLTIGITCCLFTSLVPLPALLGLLTRKRAKPPDEGGGGAGQVANEPQTVHGTSQFHVGAGQADAAAYRAPARVD